MSSNSEQRSESGQDAEARRRHQQIIETYQALLGDHADVFTNLDEDPEVVLARLAEALNLATEYKSPPPAARLAIDELEEIEAESKHKSQVCTVCSENYKVGDIVKRLPCKHNFHESCIVPWLHIRNTCPLCRFELPTLDVNYEALKYEKELLRRAEQESANLRLQSPPAPHRASTEYARPKPPTKRGPPPGMFS